MGRHGELALLQDRSRTLAACIREAGPELGTEPGAPSMLLLSSLSPLTLGEGGGVPACLPASLSNTNSSSVTRAVVMWPTCLSISLLSSWARDVAMSCLGVASSSLVVSSMVRPRELEPGLAREEGVN